MLDEGLTAIIRCVPQTPRHTVSAEQFKMEETVSGTSHGQYGLLNARATEPVV